MANPEPLATSPAEAASSEDTRIISEADIEGSLISVEESDFHQYPTNFEFAGSTAVYDLNGGSEQFEARTTDLVMPPEPRPHRETFIAITRWKGRVIEAKGETFRAVLTPVLGEDGEKEAEIYLQDVPKEDRDLVKQGALFYWAIGFLKKPSGHMNVSFIRFSRLPTWSSHEIESAHRRAEELRRILDGE